MKKITVFFFTVAVILLFTFTAFADEITVVSDTWDSVSNWTKSGNSISVDDGKLIMDGRSTQQVLYKYNFVGYLIGMNYFPCAITENYRFETKLSVNEADVLGATVTVINEYTEADIYFQTDGIYMRNFEGNSERVCDITLDTLDTYALSVDGAEAEFYKNGEKMCDVTLPTCEMNAKEDLKISANGRVTLDDTSLTRISKNHVISDNYTDLSKVYSSTNMEINTMQSAAKQKQNFSCQFQCDTTDYSNGGNVVYEVPEGTSITDFEICLRRDAANQGAFSIEMSSDGSSWTTLANNIDYITKWNYSSGGHRTVFILKNIPEVCADARYIRLSIIYDGGGGGNSNAVSPGLMMSIISYDYLNVSGVTVDETTVNTSGESLSDVDADFSKIKVSFSKGVDEALLTPQNVILLCNGIAADYSGEYDAATHNYTMKLAKKMYGASYELQIANIVFEPFTLEFTTIASDFNIISDSFTDESQTVKYGCTLKNNSHSDKKLTLVIVSYTDGFLSHSSYVDVTLNAFSQQYFETEKITVGDSVRVYFWSDIEKAIPLYKPVTKQ